MSKFIILSLFLAFFIPSCTPPPAPKLTVDMKKVVDSIYQENLDSIKNIVELECQKRHTSIYHHALDSIQDLRQEEIRSILSQ